MITSDAPLTKMKLTMSQRKMLLAHLQTHPIFRLAFTLEERMSGEYMMDRDQLMAGVYALRLALDAQDPPNRGRKSLSNMLELFEQELGITSVSVETPTE
jgi:hypothetical protein